MQAKTFRSSTLRLSLELVLAMALASFGPEMPERVSTAATWQFVLNHASLLLHVVVGTVILVEAIVLLVRAIKSHNRPQHMYAGLGLVGVLLSYGSGKWFVLTQAEVAAMSMSAGWLLALVTYVAAWFKYRRAS